MSITEKQDEDKRFCYGANCTWFGPITDVGSTEYKVKDQAERFPGLIGDTSLPCCPCCHGMLFELEQESHFWAGVHAFEAGTYKKPEELAARSGPARPHPGYRAMWEWQRQQKTCFTTVEILAMTYKLATKIEVDIAP